MSEQKNGADQGAPEVLTVDQAAGLLQISRQSLYRLLKRGEIPKGHRVGNRLRFSKRELIEWVEQN